MDIIKPILGIAKKLYSLCAEVKANKKRCQRLAQHVKVLADTVTLRELKLTLENAQDMVEKYASAKYMNRVLKAYKQGEEFESLTMRLYDSAQVLSLALQVDHREQLQQRFNEETRWREDKADREIDHLELQKLLREKVEEVLGKVDSTQEDAKDIKAFLKTLKKPRILDQDIREIKPEELIYDVPKEPFIKNDNSEIFKGEYNKFTVAIKRYAYSRSTSLSQVRIIFKKEVETMKRFESPNILRMFGICVQEESGPNPNYFIVMEFCEKGSLREVQDSQRKLPWDRKARMSLDAAQGLYRLHQSEEKFKVHGCINSSKFLVDAGYRVKLAGFELAQTETSLKRTKDRKRSSLCYSSPQQLESVNHPYNKACEMYSFGIVLWEIATGKIPFKDCSHKDVYQRVCKEKYTEPLPKDCPKQLGELINDCRSYDSFYRPTAGGNLRNVVEQLEED
uniref:Mixed lineage kinase domain like pseudokinase n=1 Tax=Salmo trutta TaxID=8032 RepID=A0A673X6Q0_SALTR